MASPGVTVAVFAMFVLAGCLSDGPTTAPASSDAPPAAGSKEGLGSILVTVTTGELAPLPDAEVVLYETSYSAFTDEAGAARFVDLEPGLYTVVVAKPGYRPVQDRGRPAEVAPDEVREVRLTMEPVEVVTAATSYHKTIPFTGFIACSFYGSLIGYTSYCGRGVYMTNGQQVGDPNDKTIHPWDVENVQIQTMLWEVKWTPSQAALGSELWARIMATWSCTGVSGQSCQPEDQIQGLGGKSPLKVRRDEGGSNNITKKLSGYNKGVYPYRVYNEVRAWCHSATSGGNCYATIMINQKYDGWQTAFYGAPQPDGFSALPPGS